MNIFDLPEKLGEQELCEILAAGENVRIERIVSCGQVSGWYDQEQTEFVVLLQGSAELEFDAGRRVVLGRGDTITIAPGERHRVASTSTEPPCVWLCVFY